MFIFSLFLIAFSMVLMSWAEAVMLVVIMILILSTWRKSAMLFELASFKYLLIVLIWKLTLLLMMIELLLLIETITCFLEGSLVVILIWDLTILNLLIILLTLMIFLEVKVRNISFIWTMSSTLIFEAWV